MTPGQSKGGSGPHPLGRGRGLGSGRPGPARKQTPSAHRLPVSLGQSELPREPPKVGQPARGHLELRRGATGLRTASHMSHTSLDKFVEPPLHEAKQLLLSPIASHFEKRKEILIVKSDDET